MTFSQVVVETLSSSSIYAAVLSTSLFVGIGYLVNKKGLFTKEMNGKISSFVFTWILPFIGINSFMLAPDPNVANVLGIVLGLSIGFYMMGVIVSWLVVKYVPALVSQRVIDKSYQLWIQSNPDTVMERYKETYLEDFRRKLIIGQQLTIYTSITFFAIPLVRALPDVFGASGIGLLWIWNISFWVLVNTHSRISISGQRIKKSEMGAIAKNLLSPILILTLLSLLLWGIQFSAPDQKLGEWFIPNAEKGSTFWNLEVTLPLIFKPLSIGVSLLSPLSWLAIGGSLAHSDIRAGAKDKSVWFFTALKLIIIPLGTFLIMIGFVTGGLLNAQVATLIVILQAAPPATIITLYAIKWGMRPDYSSQITSVATVIGLITIPIWVILSRIVFQTLQVTA